MTADSGNIGALLARIAELERELEAKDNSLSELRRANKKARSVLRMIADHRRLQSALEQAKKPSSPTSEKADGNRTKKSAGDSDTEARYERAMDVLRILAESQKLLDAVEDVDRASQSPKPIPQPESHEPRATRRSMVPGSLAAPTQAESRPPTVEQVQRLTNSPGSYFVPQDDDEES